MIAPIPLLFLLPLIPPFFCQQLANGPPPSAASSNNAPDEPSEEQLIGKLLKSPGLPPVEPPMDGGGEDESEGKEKPREEKGPAGPPLAPMAVEGFKAGQLKGRGLPPSAPPSYVQCLHQIGASVCDPDGILSEKERQEIDETLKELEAATRKEKAPTECERSGLELMVILVRHSSLLDDQMNSVQAKLNGALGIWVKDPGHKCEKPVILMLSADGQMVNRKVWTGRHWDVPVNPGELVRLFMEQEELTRKEKYGEVILNVIEGLLSRYEKRALTNGE